MNIRSCMCGSCSRMEDPDLGQWLSCIQGNSFYMAEMSQWWVQAATPLFPHQGQHCSPLVPSFSMGVGRSSLQEWRVESLGGLEQPGSSSQTCRCRVAPCPCPPRISHKSYSSTAGFVQAKQRAKWAQEGNPSCAKPMQMAP